MGPTRNIEDAEKMWSDAISAMYYHPERIIIDSFVTNAISPPKTIFPYPPVVTVVGDFDPTVPVYRKKYNPHILMDIEYDTAFIPEDIVDMEYLKKCSDQPITHKRINLCLSNNKLYDRRAANKRARKARRINRKQ